MVTCFDWPICLVSAHIKFFGGKYLRLICLLKIGHMKSKQFCATTGKTDQNAIAEIQTFFNEPTFHNWLKYFNYVRTGTVHTGIPTKRFLDNKLFDKHIHIGHSKHVNVSANVMMTVYLS